VRSNDATGLAEMTLPKRKVTAQIAEHRSCWTAVCAAENLKVKKLHMPARQAHEVKYWAKCDEVSNTAGAIQEIFASRRKGPRDASCTGAHPVCNRSLN
jgi:hypothetical protein